MIALAITFDVHNMDIAARALALLLFRLAKNLLPDALFLLLIRKIPFIATNKRGKRRSVYLLASYSGFTNRIKIIEIISFYN
jgi:hypothetical protein